MKQPISVANKLKVAVVKVNSVFFYIEQVIIQRFNDPGYN